MRKILLFFFILSFTSCTSESKNEVHDIYFFDLKSYFTKEAEKLTKQKLLINKSIEHNGTLEKKKLKIDSWLNEFALFIESDINKVSWKNSYSIDSISNKEIYKAKDPDLKTQYIEVSFKNNHPVIIKIINKTHNYLYKTDEILEYFPDSLYIINKKQEVRLIGKNDYLITGKLKD